MHSAGDAQIKVSVWNPEAAKLIILSSLLGLMFKLYPTAIYYAYFEHESISCILQRLMDAPVNPVLELVAINATVSVAKVVEPLSVVDVGHIWLGRLTRMSALFLCFMCGFLTFDLISSWKYSVIFLYPGVLIFSYIQYIIGKDFTYISRRIKDVEETRKRYIGKISRLKLYAANLGRKERRCFSYAVSWDPFVWCERVVAWVFFGELFILVVWEFDTVSGIPLVGFTELGGLSLIILGFSVIGAPFANYLLFRALDENDCIQKIFLYIESFIFSVTLMTPSILQMGEIMTDDFRRCISRIIASIVFLLLASLVVVNYLIHVLTCTSKYIFAEYRIGFYERKASFYIQVIESLRSELSNMDDRSSTKTTTVH